MSDTTISDAVVIRIRKLLALAADNSGATEAEAATAASMVQNLLAQHNISMAELEATSPTSQAGKREKTAHTKAAMYQYQRDLMSSLARNNFCRWWTEERHEQSFGKLRRVKRHVLLGRDVNIMTCQMVYDYLTDTMDRLLPYQGMEKRGKDALLWLAGCTERLCERLTEQRVQSEAESVARAKEEEVRARHPGAASSGTALVLVDVYQNEDELNTDAFYGYEPGTTTRKRLEREAKRREIEAKVNALVADGTDWNDAYYIAQYGKVPDWVLESRAAKAAEPEKPETEAQRKRREERQEREQSRRDERNWRRYSREAERRSHPAFQQGQQAGANISLNRQVGKTQRQSLA